LIQALLFFGSLIKINGRESELFMPDMRKLKTSIAARLERFLEFDFKYNIILLINNIFHNITKDTISKKTSISQLKRMF